MNLSSFAETRHWVTRARALNAVVSRPMPEPLEARRLFSAAYTVTDVGTLTGYSDFTAAGINDLGQVVGTATAASGSATGFLYSGSTIKTVSGTLSADAISNSGEISGTVAVPEAGGGIEAYVTGAGASSLQEFGLERSGKHASSIFVSGIDNAGDVSGLVS